MNKHIVLILSLLLLVGCNQSQAQYNEELEQAIFSLAEGQDKGEFHLEPLTDFNWDRAELFGPYTPREVIEESLGVHYRQTGGIESSEHFFLLVFLNDDKAVQYTFLYRQGGIDFTSEKGNITPSNDLIKLERKW